MTQGTAIPTLPARSLLAALRPIGQGTAGAESLESFVGRLALAHRVQRTRLERFVMERLADLRGPSKPRGQPHRLDAPSQRNREFAERLAELTGRPGVAQLGFGPLNGVISCTGTLRQRRAWCAECFGAMRQSQIPAHWPLLWSLSGYHRCLTHGTYLQTYCPRCQSAFMTRQDWPGPMDHCPVCDRDLCQDPDLARVTFSELARHPWKRSDECAARLLGELVARIPVMAVSPSLGPPDVKRLLDSAQRRGVVETHVQLARSVGISKSTLSALQRRSPMAASLQVLIRLCVATDVSLAGLLDRNQWHEDVSRIRLNPGELKIPRERKAPGSDWDGAIADARAAIASGRAVTLHALARRWDVSHTQLRVRLGDLAQKLSADRAQQLRAEQNRRIEQLRDAIDIRFEAYWRCNTRPAVKRVARELGVSPASKVFRSAWAAVVARSQQRLLSEPPVQQALWR